MGKEFEDFYAALKDVLPSAVGIPRDMLFPPETPESEKAAGEFLRYHAAKPTNGDSEK